MASPKTAAVAQGMFSGEKQYQLRARKALPLLVRQALAQAPIKYGALAKELGMPNPRNLNYVLGSVGATLADLGKRWGTTIPALQSLAIAKGSGLPGKGFFEGFTALEKPTRQQLKAALNEFHGRTFAFPDWFKVLQELDLKPANDDEAIRSVEHARHMHGTGEGAAHKALKDRILASPSLVGLPQHPRSRQCEYSIPSGDSIDVRFDFGSMEAAVEVKPSTSPSADIARGLFQCVKYEVVLHRWRAWESKKVDVRVVLALGGAFPQELHGLKHALNVVVVTDLERQ